MTAREELMKEKVSRVLKNLPFKPGMEERINEFSQRVLLVAGLSKINELPRAKACNKETAVEELREFTKLATKLHTYINSMHRTSLEIFEEKNLQGILHPFLLQHELEQLVYVSRKEKFTPEQETRMVGKEKGRPKKMSAKIITNDLGKIYTELTGKKAARNIKNEAAETGKFLMFVGAIFDALSIKASATSQVSVRSKKMYKKSGKKAH